MTLTCDRPASSPQLRSPVPGRVRPLEPGDAHHLVSLFGRLSARSRYLRFLAPVHRLPDTVVQHLAAVDHAQHEALGAFDGGELVGVAHYFRSTAEPHRAEVSVAVADSHQGRGIGTRLVRELADLGRRRGIVQLDATALRENQAVLALLRRSGWPSVNRVDGHELLIAMTIGPAVGR